MEAFPADGNTVAHTVCALMTAASFGVITSGSQENFGFGRKFRAVSISTTKVLSLDSFNLLQLFCNNSEAFLETHLRNDN